MTLWNVEALKLGMTLWNVEALKPNPFSPVHRARKFSAVLGTTSVLSCMTILPTGAPSAVMSKYTRVDILFFGGQTAVDGYLARVERKMTTQLLLLLHCRRHEVA